MRMTFGDAVCAQGTACAWLERTCIECSCQRYFDAHEEAARVWDDFAYGTYNYNEPSKETPPPLSIFQAPPPFGKRIVTGGTSLEEIRVC